MPDQNANSWSRFWTGLGARGDANLVFQSITSKYATPPRAYHNLTHIADCLAEFAPARALAHDVNAIEMAIWFHDIIYDSRAKDNEENSAAVALEVIRIGMLPVSFASRVKEIILATKHSAPPGDADSALMVDVDLSVLGRSTKIFDDYELQIRDEYSWVTNEAFAAGRSAVLRTFLERPAIYSTDFFRGKYEANARANLARSIKQLKAAH